MKLVEVLSPEGLGRPVSYFPSIALAFKGVKRALWICQFCYWKGKEDEEGWVYKTEAAIRKETGLSEREQRSVKKWLLEKKICKIEKRKSPPRNHYNHDWDKINEMWNNRPIDDDETSPLNRTNGRHRARQKDANLYTETTAEITSQTTKKAPPKNGAAPVHKLADEWCSFAGIEVSDLIGKDWNALKLHLKKGADIEQLKSLSEECPWKAKSKDISYLYSIRASLLPKIKPKGTGYRPLDLSSSPVMSDEQLKEVMGGNQ